MTLGDAIKLIRTARHMKQRELAGKIGVAPNYLSMLEANKRQPSLEILERLAAELTVPAGLFLLWTEADRQDLKPSKLRQVRELLVRIQEIYLEDSADSSHKESAALA